jgi:uncharacterized hydantoinase/oxoprolinase family protein
VGLRDRERTLCVDQPSHAVESIRRVCRRKCPDPSFVSEMAISDMSLALAASNVDEALAEIECQRELILELMRCGQSTEPAEQALKSMLRQFANMVEHEYDVLAEALETTGKA